MASTAEDRLHSERGEEIAADHDRLVADENAGPVTDEDGHVLEGAVLLFPVAEILVGDYRAVLAAFLAGLPDHHQPVGLRKRQPPQHHGMHDREDGSSSADAQGHGEDRDRRERGVLSEHANGILDIAGRASTAVQPQAARLSS